MLHPFDLYVWFASKKSLLCFPRSGCSRNLLPWPSQIKVQVVPFVVMTFKKQSFPLLFRLPSVFGIEKKWSTHTPLAENLGYFAEHFERSLTFFWVVTPMVSRHLHTSVLKSSICYKYSTIDTFVKVLLITFLFLLLLNRKM